jgi:hypothetical protein
LSPPALRLPSIPWGPSCLQLRGPFPALGRTFPALALSERDGLSPQSCALSRWIPNADTCRSTRFLVFQSPS